ncbi:hypothetical protein B4144_0982 [Bacillus atrophaeus]|nr:hypothetical protein D068_cds09230 [Bacillus atrophaeus UCMB-5137]KYD03136.1 hypothetical protein B4144_0982 [Bacillus atrophaeus]
MASASSFIERGFFICGPVPRFVDSAAVWLYIEGRGNLHHDEVRK